MPDWGKSSQAGNLETIQAEAWKRLFQGLEANPQGFILFDRSLHVIACNPAAAEISKLINQKPVHSGDQLTEIFPQAIWSQLTGPIHEALAGKKSSLGLNAANRNITLFFHPLQSAPTETGLVLINLLDLPSGISEPGRLQAKEQAEEQRLDRIASLEKANRQLKGEIEQILSQQLALQSSEAFFRTSFESLPEPTLIWGKDDQNEIRILAANHAAADLTGIAREDLQGLLLEDFYARSLHFIGLVQTAFSSGEIRQVEQDFISHVQTVAHWVACDCIRLSEKIVLNTLRDISQQKDRQQHDATNHNQVELLRQAMTAFTSVLNMDQVLLNVIEYLQKLIPYNRVLLYLVDGNDLRIRATHGFTKDTDPLGNTIPLRNPQFEAINRNRQPLFLSNAREYRPFETLSELNCGASWLGVPLLGHGQVLGYLSLYADEPAQYTADHTRLAEIFANEASIAIENARLFEQVQLLAVTDELTSFYNRRYFYELVEIELARARRYHHPTSLIMIDVDLFKLVNDRFGHTTGDLVLKETCAVIRKAVRESDILGRYGGEEFVLLLPETALERAVEVAERLRLLVQNHSVKVGDQEISISISAGIASLGEACKDADGLFRCADLAMYHAKQAGRNQVYAASELPDNKSLL